MFVLSGLLVAPLLALGSPLVKRASPSQVTQCLSAAGLAPVVSSSSSYTSSIAAFNQRLQPSPLAVIYPTTQDQVSNAVRCAIGQGVPISARGGGHSYASFGLGGTDGALVIDMTNFKIITINQDARAKIGSGNHLGDVAVTLATKSRALPHGVGPWVGLGGHASYGGFGPWGRQKGLTVDAIIGLDVVLANGTIINNLTAKRDSMVFWALRGAAPSYGLITAFYFSTFAMPSVVINFSYTWKGISVDVATSVFSKFQAFGASHAPAELGLTCSIKAGRQIQISGVYQGTMDNFHNTMVTFVKSFPSGFARVANQFTWIQSLNDLSGGQYLNITGHKDYRDNFYTKSLMTPEDKLIPDTVLRSFINYLFTTTTTTVWFVEVNLYGGQGSAINAVSRLSNSFGHRNKLLTFQMYASSSTFKPPFPSEGFKFVQGIYNSIQTPMGATWNANTPSEAYVNYVDPTLTNAEVASLYYPSQYLRLSKLRSIYDPQQLF